MKEKRKRKTNKGRKKKKGNKNRKKKKETGGKGWGKLSGIKKTWGSIF